MSILLNSIVGCSMIYFVLLQLSVRLTSVCLVCIHPSWKRVYWNSLGILIRIKQALEVMTSIITILLRSLILTVSLLVVNLLALVF